MLMKYFLIVLFFIPIILTAQTMTGQWTFDNPSNLLDATVGNDLVLSGTHSIAAGPTPTDGAINIGVGSYYKVTHGIPANGGGSMVNEFTLVIDFKLPCLSQWYCFMQTYYPNVLNDGDAFIDDQGALGVGATGYSTYTVSPNEWYRLVIAVDLGSTYKYYLDGQFALDGGNQTLDGRFSLYPTNPAKPLLLFADNDGEDNALNVAYAAIYNGCMNAAQVQALGGYGHSVISPTDEMMPYLQTPTPNSMYVCWHGASGSESRVEYGTTPSLGLSVTGTVYDFNSSTRWHSVKLQNLQPDTEYFYQCHTGAQISSVCSFHTPPAIGSRTGHYRFLIMGDSQSNYGTSTYVVRKAVQKMTELYGSNWHYEIDMLCHVGDTVFNGLSLSGFTTEHFIPFAPLSSSIPIIEAIGNHELESSYFYNYRKVEDFGGPEGEKYFHFDVGSMRFLFLNPNISTSTETTWLQNRISEAQGNTNIDWIFSFAHEPAYTEMWPDGESSWMQSTVLPYLSASSKATLLANGHSHCYERGVAPDGNLTTLISGGSGGTLDYWGEYSNQTDYNNTIKAMPDYNYVLVDVDLAARSFIATTYSLGNTNRPRDNEIIDQFTFYQNIPTEQAPLTEAQSAMTGSQVILTASPANHSYTQMSTRYQVSSSPTFSSILADVTRQKSDIYGDTGSPLWQPIDVNASINIWRYQLAAGVLQNGNTYYWRVKSRDTSTKWTGWSTPASFVLQTQSPHADFTIHNNVVDVNEPVYFVETSVGNASSFSWDFNGDGTPDSSVRDPYWTYTSPGIYNVALTVMISGLIYSITKLVTVNGGTLTSPTNLYISRISDDIHITWDTVPGATYYRVLYYTDPYALNPLTMRETPLPEIIYFGFGSQLRGFFKIVAVQ
jgi:PKD repeat protein